MKKISILDYGIGNVRSIKNALDTMNVEAVLTDSRAQIMDSAGLVLPGVGAFTAGMGELNERGLCEQLRDFVQSGRPLIAICLGMQMLFEESEEFGVTTGLGLIPGKVVRMPIGESSEKLPHIGWNRAIEPRSGRWNGTVMNSTEDGAEFYFVHSYCGQPADPSTILSETEYGEIRFCSAVQYENIYGFQYHPEKSGPTGLKILEEFSKQCS